MKKNKYLKISLLLNLLLCVALAAVIDKTDFIGTLLPAKTESFHNPNYEQRLTLFESVQTEQADVVFLGDSITERALWSELFPEISTANRGIAWDTTGGVLDRLDNVIELKPEKIFLMIGVNDLSLKTDREVTLENYAEIIETITEELPDTQLYVQSILPVRADYARVRNEDVDTLNAEILKLTQAEGVAYIDINSRLKTADSLDPAYTDDGIHLKGEAYMIWVDEIQKYMD